MTTIVAVVLALAKTFGWAVIGGPGIAAIDLMLYGYVVVYLFAPFFVFTVVCLSSRLRLRHVPRVGAITAIALPAVTFCFLGFEAVFLLPFTVVWWGAQIAFIGLVYYHTVGHDHQPDWRRSIYPANLSLPVDAPTAPTRHGGGGEGPSA